jgi:hypothetical protein
MVTELELTEFMLLNEVGQHRIKIRPGRIDDGAYRHHMLIGYVAVRKNAIIGIQFFNQSGQIFFGINRNIFNCLLSSVIFI